MADTAATNKVVEDGGKAGNDSAIDDTEVMDTHMQNTVHQRLRANSSIMKLKKILGMRGVLRRQRSELTASSCQQRRDSH